MLQRSQARPHRCCIPPARSNGAVAATSTQAKCPRELRPHRDCSVAGVHATSRATTETKEPSYCALTFVNVFEPHSCFLKKICGSPPSPTPPRERVADSLGKRSACRGFPLRSGAVDGEEEIDNCQRGTARNPTHCRAYQAHRALGKRQRRRCTFRDHASAPRPRSSCVEAKGRTGTCVAVHRNESTSEVIRRSS